MQNDIKNFDPNDDGLKEIFGDRFTDATAQTPEKPKATRKPSNTTQTEKVAQKPAQKPTKENEAVKDAQWQPVKPDPNWLDHLTACAKWALIFGGLNMLIFYWQQAGLMAESIAVPCMWVCCVLAGLGVGTNFVRGER